MTADDPTRPDCLRDACADEVSHDPSAAEREDVRAEAARLRRQQSTWSPRGVMPEWGVGFGGMAT